MREGNDIVKGKSGPFVQERFGIKWAGILASHMGVGVCLHVLYMYNFLNINNTQSNTFCSVRFCSVTGIASDIP